MIIRVGIIGTAGRQADAAKLNAALFDAMVADAAQLIGDIAVTLVSGGAAFADHVAVALWLRGGQAGCPLHKLELHLPAKWDITRAQYVEVIEDSKHPGTVSNRYHRAFSSSCNRNSLRELNEAITAEEVLVRVTPGFKPRNMHVGRVDKLIAYTFGDSRYAPTDGGTAHTWMHSYSPNKIHRALNDLGTAKLSI